MIWALGLVLAAEADTLVAFRQGSAQAHQDLELSWAKVEPTTGQWDFSATDAVIAAAEQPVAATLFPGRFRGGSPPDAAEHVSAVLGPRGKAYVRATVKRYGDRVQVWRIGEDWTIEPANPETASQVVSAADVGQFLRAVVAEVRAHDADALIIGPRLLGPALAAVSGQLSDGGPDHWAETGDPGAMVRTVVSAWAVDQGPLFWVLPEGEEGRTMRSTVGLLQAHIAGSLEIARVPNLEYEQYGYRFTRADGATRWIYWGQGEVPLSVPWPKAVTSVNPGDNGRHVWRGAGDVVTLSPSPVLLRN